MDFALGAAPTTRCWIADRFLSSPSSRLRGRQRDEPGLKRGGRIVGIKGEPAHGTAILTLTPTGYDGGQDDDRHVRHAEGSDAAAGEGRLGGAIGAGVGIPVAVDKLF